MTEKQYSKPNFLQCITIVGGFLDGQKFDFTNGLNCIIGARGTGKTTVLEFIRYVLDDIPENISNRKQLESLITKNLSGGHLELFFKHKDSLSYKVNRPNGESSIIIPEKGDPTDLILNTKNIISVDIYSQNQIENIADDSMSQLKLIDNFNLEIITKINNELQVLKSSLNVNANEIIPLQNKKNLLKEEFSMLPYVEEKLKTFGTEGGEDSEEINKAHQLKALRDKEIRTISYIKNYFEKASQNISEMTGWLLNEISTLEVNGISEGENDEIFKTLFDDLQDCESDIDEFLNKAQERINKEYNKIKTFETNLLMRHKDQEMLFRKLIEKHKEIQGKAAERSKLEIQRNELIAKKREHENISKQLDVLLKKRSLINEKISELYDKRFNIRKEIIEKINKSLEPSIKVSITQFGNPEHYKKFLENNLKNSALRHKQVANKIMNAFWPSELSDIIKKDDVENFALKAELNKDQARKTIDSLYNAQILFDLETIELIDLPMIELNDHGTYKTTETLSTGQKCNTILPIILMDSDNPLLIDQPEDNLDNSFVYETVVESIRKVKKSRQLILVTHNPNIPVLGEAEKIFVLDSDGKRAFLKNQGSVDHCKDDIVTLLEGGETAFKKRKNRYAY